MTDSTQQQFLLEWPVQKMIAIGPTIPLKMLRKVMEFELLLIQS